MLKNPPILTKRLAFLLYLLFTVNTISANFTLNPHKTHTIFFNSINPTTGTSGTIVTLTSSTSSFTSADKDNVTLGGVAISDTAVTFISADEIEVEVPCNATSGFFSVNGVQIGAEFTYLNPVNISTTLNNAEVCDGFSFNAIPLSGQLIPMYSSTGPITFNYTNSNTAINLQASGSGVDEIPTFTAENNALEPITSTVTVTPVVNGCEGTPVSFTITVNPKPVLNPIANIEVCNNTNISDIVLTASSPTSGTGVLYTWSRTNQVIGNLPLSGSGSPIPAFTAKNTTSNDIISTITVVPTYKGCQGEPFDFTITVNPASNPGAINATVSTICEGDNTTISLSNPIGNVLRWESSTDNFLTKNTLTNSTESLTVSPVTTTKYRAIVLSGTCTEATSSAIEIVVNETVVSGTAIGGKTICKNATADLELTGSNGTVSYWQYSIDNGANWIGISGSASNKYTTLPLDRNTSFRAMVKNGTCTEVASAETQVTIASPIDTGNLIVTSPSITVCEDTSVNLELANFSGTIVEWQSKKVSSSVWTSISNTTDTYTSGLLTESTDFRVLLENGTCQTIFTSIVNVIVEKEPVFSKPVMASGFSSPVCQGSTIDIDFSITQGSLIRWESRANSGASWATYNDMVVSGANTYTTAAINNTVGFRAILSSTTTGVCGEFPSDVIAVATNAPGASGTLTATDSEICANTATAITLTGQSGVVIGWESSTTGNSGSWVLDTTNTSTTYNTGILTQNTFYRAVSSNGVCSQIRSSEIEIKVNPVPNVPVIVDQEVCFGVTVTFGEVTPTPGYSYEWSSLSGGVFTETTSSVTRTITASEEYTLKVSSAAGCLSTQSFKVTMLPLPTATVATAVSICEGQEVSIGAASKVGSTYSWVASPAYVWNPPTVSSTSANPKVSPIETTTFTLTETITATGCTNTNSVTITVDKNPIVSLNRGTTITMCDADASTNLEATITGSYNSIRWEEIPNSSGDINILSPTEISFTPSPSAIANGSALVRLFVTNTCGEELPALETTINIARKSTADAGTDIAGCGTNPITLDGSNSTFATGYSWSKPSDITGTLTFANTANPVFTPSTSDALNANTLYSGGIPFTLTTSSASCASSTSTVLVTIVPSPIVSAGPSAASICEDGTYKPTGTSEDNTVSLKWTTSGDGTFIDATDEEPTYTPGVNDKAAGSVKLTLTGTGNIPCATTTSETILTIVKNPTIDPIADATVCAGLTTPLNLTANIQNPGTILWTTSNGGGSFNGTQNSATPIYTPVVTDFNTGITFTVTVAPISPCGTTVSETFINTINAAPIVDAGGNATICESQPTVTLNGTASNVTSVTWTSTGAGSFDNANDEDPTYTFAPSDIANGSVTFTITGSQTSCDPETDIVTVTIQKKPVVTAGLAQTICQGESVTLNGTSSEASGVSWVRTGGSGTFTNTNTLNPTYTSSASETGTITFTIVGQPKDPCTGNSTAVSTTVTIIPNPTADAGVDATICEGEDFEVTTASATNISGNVIWSAGLGGGTFTGGNTLRPTYTPSATDISRGYAKLTITALKDSPCTVDAVSEMRLDINKIPSITVINPSVAVCSETAPFEIPDVSAVDYDSLEWTTSGSGTFTDNNPANTITANFYTPSAADVASGSVVLTLKASRIPSNCNSSTTNSITLDFVEKPIVEAGNDATICGNTTYTTSSATASNYSQATWLSTGTGTFINQNDVSNATYTPSATDIANGSVTLTLALTGLVPCLDVISDTMELSFEAIPVITTVGTDAICNTSTNYSVSGTSISNNYMPVSLANWTTSGTGTFTATTDPLNPNYTPSAADLTQPNITLTLTIDPVSPCITPQTETIVLDVIPAPIVDAGVNLSECDVPFTITTATAIPNTYSSLQWVSSSGGTFVGGINNTINPTYIPSATDISAGTVDLTLTAFPINPCSVVTVSTITVSIQASPEITVTNQAPICEDAENVTVTGTAIINAANFIYTSTTGTIINNETTLTPTVTPSATDIANGEIILTVTATPLGNCTSVSETITIPVVKNPIVNAGVSKTFCEGESITTSDATASNVAAGNLQWENNGGDGVFSTSANGLITTYIPGSTEIANGAVQLTLTGTATSPCATNATDTVVYTLLKKPVLTVSPTIVSICEDENYQVPANQVNITNFDNVASVVWSASSPGTITTGGTLDLTPTFTPSAADIANGFSELTITVTPTGACATAVVSEKIRVNIGKNPTIDVSQNTPVFCEGENKQLQAIFTNEDPSTYNWEIVSGTGSISNNTINTPLYTPELDSDVVVIRVSVTGNSPCANTVSEEFTLNKIGIPQVTLPENATTVCSTENTIDLTATVTNTTVNTTYQWVSSSATAAFSNPTAINTSYTFSASDKANGSVTLSLKAQSDADCMLNTTDAIVVTIKQAPVVNITNLATEICEDAIYNATATAPNATTYLWEKVGVSDGTFISGENTTDAKYIPGTNDILNKTFTLKFIATGDATCAPVSEEVTVAIVPKPIVTFATDNGINCSTEPFVISGVNASNYSTLSWSSLSTAPGTFSNDGIENPTYTPSATEIAGNSPITLRLTLQPETACIGVVPVFKDFTLNLLPAQTANAGLDVAICEGEVVNLNGATTNNASQYWTSSSSGVTFATTKNATYTPTALDISTGNVTLTLHSVSNTNCAEVTDSMVVQIVKQPEADAGPTVTICEDESYTLLAGEATANNAASVLWTLSGAGQITSGTETTLTPEFIPAPGQTGNVTLTLTANAALACASLSDVIATKTIRIIPKPKVTIPSSRSICEGDNLLLLDADINASDFTTLNWVSSNGLGSFVTQANGNTTYMPANNQTGVVTLSFVATPLNTACSSVQKDLVLTIHPNVQVSAGTDVSICEDETVVIQDANINYGNGVVNWSIVGPASITPGTENTLTPEIVPNVGASGLVTVTLEAAGSSECPTSKSDSVTIAINALPIVSAGTPQEICEGETEVQLNGTVSNAASFNWSHSGDGTIVATTNPLKPKYIPGAADFINPSGINTVNIFLEAVGNNTCGNITATTTITLQANPKANAGVDMVACVGDVISLNAATASNFNTLSWETSGNGTFDYTTAGGQIKPTYTLGSNDTTEVTLTMIATPNGVCTTNTTDEVVVSINQLPTITATTEELTFCGSTFTLPSIVSVANSTSYTWTNTTAVANKSIVVNPNSLTPTISPTAEEIANGFISLTVTAQPKTACVGVATKAIKVNLTPVFTVDAGNPITVCATNNPIVLNFGATTSSTTGEYYWTSNGAGTILSSSLNTLQPQYQPGPNETGTIEFTLHVTNAAPCSGEVTDTVNLVIDPLTTVDAGLDIAVCEGSSVNITNAKATNYTSLQWIASSDILGNTISDGSFSPANAAVLNATYSPSAADIARGFVYLTLQSTNSCGTVSDYLRVNISEGAGVFAGNNATVCVGDSYEITDASATNTSSVVWASAQNANGTSLASYVAGSFSNINATNPVYTPSASDLTQGYVYLILTGNGESSCSVDNSFMRLDFVKTPSLVAQDVAICVDTPSVTLNTTALDYDTITWSVFSGSGTISAGANSETPVFTSNISTTITTPQTTILKAVLTPKNGCDTAETVVEEVVITTQPLPTVNAGDDGFVCYTPGQPIGLFTINNTTFENASSVEWSTSGNGVFSSGFPTTYQSLTNTCSETVQLTLTATGMGACGTKTVSDVVNLTINCAAPSLGVITSSTTPNVCQGTTATYQVTANSLVTDYQWSVPSGATIQSQSANTITVAYSENAVSGIVSVAAKNSCGVGELSTLAITIAPMPKVTTISGPSVICEDLQDYVFTAGVIADATSYIWTLTDGSTITTLDNTLTIAGNTSLPSGNLTVKGVNSCGDGINSLAFPIEVVSKPTLTSTVTNSAICSGDTFDYQPTSVTGASFSWTRSQQSGIEGTASGNGAVQDVLINTTNSVKTVTYQIEITTATGCSATEQITVPVNPVAQLTNAPADSEICSGSVFGFNPTSDISGTITWVRPAVTGIQQASTSGSGNISETLTNTTNAALTVNYELTLPTTTAGCTTTAIVSVEVLPTPAAATAISGPLNVCLPSTNNIYTVAAIPNATSYDWRFSDGTIRNTNSNSISLDFTTSTTSETLEVRGVNCGNGAFSAPFTITGINLPTITNTPSATSICSNELFSFTPISATANSFTWERQFVNGIATPVSSGSGSINEILVNETNIPITVTYLYTITSPESCTNTATINIIVKPLPKITNTPVASICSGGTFNFVPEISTSATESTNISWSRVASFGIIGSNDSGTGSISETLENTTNAVIPVTYNLILTNATSGCETTDSIIVDVYPLATAVIESSDNTCVNSADSFINFKASNGIAPYTFTYTVNGGSEKTITTNAISSSVQLSLFANTIGAYTYRLLGVKDSGPNTCTNNFVTPKEITVIISANPILNITNPATICATETVDLTDPAYTVGSDTGLTYTYWEDVNATVPYLLATTATEGTYYIKAENANGCTTIKAIVVNENALPLVQIENNESEIFVCEGSEVSLNASGAQDYQWYSIDSSGGSSILNTTDVYTYTPTVNQTIYLRGTDTNGCESSTQVAIILKPAIKASIEGVNNYQVCKDADDVTITFKAANGIAPYTFTYLVNNNIKQVTTIAASNKVAVTLPTDIAGVFDIELIDVKDSSLANCNNPIFQEPKTASVTVFDSEILPVANTEVFQTVCFNDPVDALYFTTTSPILSAYVEGLPSGVTSSFAGNTITISGTPTVAGIFNYTVHSSVLNASCASTYSGTITVNSGGTITPLVDTEINQDICSCATITPIVFELSAGTFGANVTGLPSGLTWEIEDNIVLISGSSCATAGNYTYTVTAQGNCSSSTTTGLISITDPNSIFLINGSQTTEVCNNSVLTPVEYQANAGQTLQLIGVLPQGVTFIADTATGTAIISGTPERAGTYNYTITSDSECSDFLEGSIEVSADPFISLMSGSINQESCIENQIENIRYQISENNTNISFTPSLPAGISYSENNGQLVISGAATSTSISTIYTIGISNNCGVTVTSDFKLEILEKPTIVLDTNFGAATQSVCQNSAINPIQFSVSPIGTKIDKTKLPGFITATEIDASIGLWELTGAPGSTGIFNFNIETINSSDCSAVLPIEIENIYSAVDVTLESGSDSQLVCNFNSPIEDIVYKISGTITNINSINVVGLPTGISYSKTNTPSGILLTISGTASETGIFNYDITHDTCGAIESGMIRISSQIALNSTVTQISCTDELGSIEIDIYGGLPFIDENGNVFYNISWSGPNGFRQNQTEINGLIPGDYTVNIIDALGCVLSVPETFTINPVTPININLLNTTLANGCNGELGCANLDYTGGSGIYTNFLLEVSNPQTQVWEEKIPNNNNYFNICGLDAGIYRISVTDSKSCTTEPVLFTIENDNQFTIEDVVVEQSLCEGNTGLILVDVNSVDTNLTFALNGTTLAATPLGNNLYELEISTIADANATLEISNSSGCTISEEVIFTTLEPDFEYTSFEFENFGFFEVNTSIEFTNLSFVDTSIYDPNVYTYIKWDFDDNSPFKTFYYPDNIASNADGENLATVFHAYKNDGIYNVKLTLYNASGCETTITKTIFIGKGSSVLFPTAFSPNNDNINDLFRPKHLGFSEITLYIYDSLGNIVYEFTSTDALSLENDDTWGWDGIEPLSDAPKSGNYRCYFIGKTIDNKVVEKNIRFLIIK